jgi:uncharacterized protein YciI
MNKQVLGCGILFFWMLGTTLATVAQTPAAAQAETKTCLGRANKTKIQAYLMLPRLRWDLYAKWKETGVWQANAETDRALDAHSEYWAKQLKDGRAVLAGAMNGDFWDNVALIVFEAASLEEAETLTKNDPALKAYAFQARSGRFLYSGSPTSFRLA